MSDALAASPLGGLSSSAQAALAPIFSGPGVRVRQSRELLQALTGWSTANCYRVTTKEGKALFEAKERGGLWNLLSRRFNPFYENVTDVVAPSKEVLFRVVMPWALWFRKARVELPSGAALGRVQRRFHFFRTRCDVLSATGEVELRLRGPWFKFFFFTDWVFTVERADGTKVGALRKHWGGFVTEAITNADSFSVEFEPGFTDPRLRLLLVTATFLLDLVRFEEQDKNVQDQLEGKSKEPTFDD